MFVAEVLKLFQFFVPFFNSWWLILAFSEYIEGRGNELYYIAGRMKSGLAVLWTAIYFCLTGLPFVFLQNLASDARDRNSAYFY